jgi:hypothetical protein
MRILFKQVLLIFFLMLCFGQALAQTQELAEFKDINLPFALKSENVLLEKGKYDFVLIRNLPNVFLLKIKKQGKTVDLISGGEKINYPAQGDITLLQNSPDIPKFGKLTIKSNPALKIAYIILETGKQARLCPYHKIRFKLEYVE